MLALSVTNKKWVGLPASRRELRERGERERDVCFTNRFVFRYRVWVVVFLWQDVTHFVSKKQNVKWFAFCELMRIKKPRFESRHAILLYPRKNLQARPDAIAFTDVSTSKLHSHRVCQDVVLWGPLHGTGFRRRTPSCMGGRLAPTWINFESVAYGVSKWSRAMLGIEIRCLFMVSFAVRVQPLTIPTSSWV